LIRPDQKPFFSKKKAKTKNSFFLILIRPNGKEKEKCAVEGFVERPKERRTRTSTLKSTYHKSMHMHIQLTLLLSLQNILISACTLC
jgi:hypothetical protein